MDFHDFMLMGFLLNVIISFLGRWVGGNDEEKELGILEMYD